MPREPAVCWELILFTYVARVGLVGDGWGHRAGGGQAPTPSSCSGRGPSSMFTPASGPQRGGDLLSWTRGGLRSPGLPGTPGHQRFRKTLPSGLGAVPFYPGPWPPGSGCWPSHH